jgi:hypothetical protein
MNRPLFVHQLRVMWMIVLRDQMYVQRVRRIVIGRFVPIFGEAAMQGSHRLWIINKTAKLSA